MVAVLDAEAPAPGNEIFAGVEVVSVSEDAPGAEALPLVVVADEPDALLPVDTGVVFVDDVPEAAVDFAANGSRERPALAGWGELADRPGEVVLVVVSAGVAAAGASASVAFAAE